MTYLLFSLLLSFGILVVTKMQPPINKLYDGLVIYGRYYVGLFMLLYGSVKFFEGQFAPPGYLQLEKTFGDASPMNLLWTFMGASKWYTMFAGFGEVVGGLLIMYRRTKVIGALVTIGVMANVVMMNLSYDVPVKLFSSHLVLISLFIILPDLQSIVQFFFLNKSAILAYRPVKYPEKWMFWAKNILKPLLFVSVPVLRAR